MMDLVQQGVYSLILTSGTLSPLNSFAAELGVPFPVQLENPHVIDNDQVFIGVVTQGPDGTALNSSYQNRSNIQYVVSLGRTLVNLGRMVPDGMLVFFPSYSVLRSSVTKWEESGIWNSLSAIKSIFTEPQGKVAFQEAIAQYYEKIENPDSPGAVLLAVCRGKVSEGLDFADKNARAVFITGLPFPPSQDPRVKLKMSYLNECCKQKGLSGSEWYLLQASRVVNQAVGRVIRHRSDYGAIIFCDNRFSEKRISSQLSNWLQGQIHIYNSFGSALKELSNFYRTIEKKTPSVPKSHSAFLPTAVRKVVVKKSTMNEMKRSNDDVEMNRSDDDIVQGYLPTLNTKAHIKSARCNSSIFDAIDAHMASRPSPNVILIEHEATTNDHVNQINRSENAIPTSTVKRRKLNVALHNINGDENEASSSKEKDSLIHEKWKQHLIEVKRALSFTNNYPKFCQAVKIYKSEKSVINFAEEMHKLFIDVPERENLLNIVSRLVSSQQRNEFLQFSMKKCNLELSKSNTSTNAECSKSSDIDTQVSDKKFQKNSLLFCGKAYQCAFCEQTTRVPMMAVCLHVCCYLCWKEIFKKNRCCPVCNLIIKSFRNLCQKFFKSAPLKMS